jgi:hypothetical protein
LNQKAHVMKKAKLFLAAIAIMGIAGGALAFKAKTASITKTTIYYTSLYNEPATRYLTEAYTTASTTTFLTEGYTTLLYDNTAKIYGYITTTSAE